MVNPAKEPLLRSFSSHLKQKRKIWFGYLPVWSETMPLDAHGEVDWVRVTANIMAGFIIGIRQTLSAIVSATLVYTSTDSKIVTGMFPFGISMMWYSTMVGSMFYGIFGRLQYNTNATQEVCAILYGAMAQKAADHLRHDAPERIPPTVLALIMTGTVVTGVSALLFGKLGLGKIMLRFPTPVTSGFLGTIGYFLVRTALQISSGVEFQLFYPVSLSEFLAPRSLGPVACLLSMVAFMRKGPGLLSLCFPKSRVIKKLGGLICQLFPLFLFYAVALSLGYDNEMLSEGGWTYPAQTSGGFMSLWTTYNVWDADTTVVFNCMPEISSLVLISVLCTMTGVLGITGKFPSGPEGDPAPDEVVDFDQELSTVGFAAVLVGLSNGVVTFHRLGSSVQLRMDGGTHRIGVLSSACFVGFFFFSSVPLGHFIPKWFLGGLFMGSGISFLEGSFLSYRALPPSKKVFLGHRLPSPQYIVTILCILVAALRSPNAGIAAGLGLSIILFLWESAETLPVGSMSDCRHTVSRTLRPFWELRTMRREGERAIILYLQGQLFFGSGQSLCASIIQAVEGKCEDLGGSCVRFCILSFAKVPNIDASAADQLRACVKKVARHGCKIICCRMNTDVFNALAAAQVVSCPDDDLRNVLAERSSEDLQTSEGDDVSDFGGGSTREEANIGLAVGVERPLQRSISFRAPYTGDHDAFDHETDALDFCGDKIISEFCYGEADAAGVPDAELKPYMLNYRTSCVSGRSISEEVFEQMTQLPAGTMTALKPHCEVRAGLAPGTELKDKNTLFLIMKGAVALVDQIDPKPRASSGLVSMFNIKGFHGRGGKRLRKRYPPGSIIGKLGFFLQERLVDEDMLSDPVVSGKFASTAEVWALSWEAFQGLPPGMRKALQDMALQQFAAEREHTLLSGE